MSHKLERNKRCDHEPVELYEQVDPTVHNRSSHSQSRYNEPSFQTQPPVTSVAPSASIATQGIAKEKKQLRMRSTILIALTTTLLICLLVVSLVAVILYSPQMRTSSESAVHTDSQDNLLLSPLHNLTVQATIDQLSSSVTTLTSQLVSVQNLIQSITSVQNNLRGDLNRLRSVNLYQGCIQNTRTCTMSTGGSSGYYWTSCSTSGLNANPQVKILYYTPNGAFTECYWFNCMEN